MKIASGVAQTGKHISSELHTNSVRVRIPPGPKYFQNENDMNPIMYVFGFTGISRDAGFPPPKAGLATVAPVGKVALGSIK